jgi:hypothetical protein
MNSRYPAVASRAAQRCEYCRAPEAIFNFPFEVEHIFPIGRGGTDADSNLALACRSCNLRKGSILTAVDPETVDVVALFHPRQHSWRDHFEVSTESGEIIGLTAIGRATVASLQLNSITQVAARRQWMQLHLFP